ncbi:MAG: glycosyltransferase family 9 protein [Armatimonadota bacterium]|nr:glycosyltransferase family 9 protein [Armatimonadota bacterium]
MKPLPPLAEIDRLLIVKTSSIGDVIHALPVVQAIKAARPGLTLGWVVRRRCADVLRGNPDIDHLYVTENKPSLGELMRLRRELHTVQYQMALDMQGLLLSGVVTRLSGAPVRIGWDRNREGNALFLTHPIVSGKAADVVRHEVDLLYGFAEVLGVQIEHSEFAPQPYLSEEGREWAETRLVGLSRPGIALNVGASRAYKRWPAERWAVVADALASQGHGLVFVGDKNDAEIVQAVKRQMKNAGRALDLSGQTNLRQLAAVLEACDLLASADTGPMHLAVAVGTPVVAVFGATDPHRHGPYGARNVVLHKPVPGMMQGGKRPTDEAGTACLAAISPDDVLTAIDAKLSKMKLYA